MPTPTAANTTGINTWTGAFLKIFYQERARDARSLGAIPFTSGFYNGLQRLEVGGSEGNSMPAATTSRITTGNISAAGRAIREALPPPSTVGGGQLVFIPRYSYWAAQMANQMPAVTRNDQMAFARALALEMKGQDDYDFWKEHTLMGDGNGAICWSNGSTTTADAANTMRELFWNPATLLAREGRILIGYDMSTDAYVPTLATGLCRAIGANDITDTTIATTGGTNQMYAAANDKLVGYASAAGVASVLSDLANFAAGTTLTEQRVPQGMILYVGWQGPPIGDQNATPDRTATTFADYLGNALTIRPGTATINIGGVNRNTNATFHPKVLWHPAVPGTARALTSQMMNELVGYIVNTKRQSLKGYECWTSWKVLYEYFNNMETRRFFGNVKGSLDEGMSGAKDPKTGAVSGLTFAGLPIHWSWAWPSRYFTILRRSDFRRVWMGEPGPVYPGSRDPWFPVEGYDVKTFGYSDYWGLACLEPQYQASVADIAFSWNGS